MYPIMSNASNEPQAGKNWTAPDGRVFKWNPLTGGWSNTSNGERTFSLWKSEGEWFCSHYRINCVAKESSAVSAYGELIKLVPQKYVEDL